MSLLLVAGGCKSETPKVKITGKVLKDGQPLHVSKMGEVRVKFYSEGKDEETNLTRTADYDSDTGNYVIKSIPVGKYRVAVEQIDPMPSNKNDKLQGAFSRKNTEIFRDVEQNDQVIDIDLSKEKSKKTD